MIENQTTVYYEHRMSHESYIAMELRKFRYREPKKTDVPCIKPVNQIVGSRFDVRS